MPWGLIQHSCHVLGNGPWVRQQLDLEYICLIKEQLLWESKMQDYKYKKRTKTFLRRWGICDILPGTPAPLTSLKAFSPLGPWSGHLHASKLCLLWGHARLIENVLKQIPQWSQDFLKQHLWANEGKVLSQFLFSMMNLEELKLTSLCEIQH